MDRLSLDEGDSGKEFDSFANEVFLCDTGLPLEGPPVLLYHLGEGIYFDHLYLAQKT